MRWTRALPVVSIVFPVIYVLAMYFNWPVFTYVPRTGEFHLLLFAPPGKQGPAMYYYGWLLTSAFVAAAAGAVSAYAPDKFFSRPVVSLTWVVPLVMIVVLLYILRTWFMH